MRRRVEKQIETVSVKTHHTLLGMLRTENKELEALCKKLAEACAYGLNLTLNGIGQHSHAIALFESGLEAAKRAAKLCVVKTSSFGKGQTMNRQHKYRGLTFARKEIKGSLILSGDGSRAFIGYIEVLEFGNLPIVHYEEVDPAMVGEFTGHKDKTVKDIYEGDNLLFNVFDYNDIDKQYTGHVYWDEDDLAWNIQCKPEVFSLGDIIRQDDELEVIGTIHNEEAKP